MIITIRHFRKGGICPRAKEWFAENNLDWKDFKRNGIDSEKLLATNDPRAVKLAEMVNAKT